MISEQLVRIAWSLNTTRMNTPGVSSVVVCYSWVVTVNEPLSGILDMMNFCVESVKSRVPIDDVLPIYHMVEYRKYVYT